MTSSAAVPRTQRIRPTARPSTEENTKLHQFGQPLTKKFGQAGLQVPVPQQLRIVEKYMQGMSIRRIAEEEDRARQTVAKIVRAPEVQDYLEKLRGEVMSLGEEMIKSVRFALRHELDGRLAYEILKDIGAIPRPPQIQPNEYSEISEEEQHERLVEIWTRRLNLLAIEKSRVYGTTLPPALQALAVSEGLCTCSKSVDKTDSNCGMEKKMSECRVVE